MPNPQRIEVTVARLAALGPGPIAVRDAIASGLTRGQLRAACESGAVFQLRRGVIIPRRLWTAGSADNRRLWAVMAALTAFPGAFASHETAARLHGLPDYGMRPEGDPPRTHITRLGASRDEGWLRVHGCDTPMDRVVRVHGVSATDLVRTSIEVAARRSMRSAVVNLDAAMRISIGRDAGLRDLRHAVLDPVARGTTQARWEEGLQPYAGRRWVTVVRRAVEIADPGSESVLESLSRLAILEAGLPAPRCGVPVRGDDGRLYWADLLWDGQGVIGEADGALKYTDASVMLAEKRRQETLEAMGWRFVRWGMPEVSPDPRVMLARIRRALDI